MNGVKVIYIKKKDFFFVNLTLGIVSQNFVKFNLIKLIYSETMIFLRINILSIKINGIIPRVKPFYAFIISKYCDFYLLLGKHL